MGQVNSNLEQDGTSNRNNILQKQLEVDPEIGDMGVPVNGYDGMKVNSLNCVRNRIDMLIEDCLNIRESAVDKKLLNVNHYSKNDENSSSNGGILDKANISGETKNETRIEIRNEKEDFNQINANAKTDVHLDSKEEQNKQEEKLVDKTNSESFVKDNKNETQSDSLEKLREEKLNQTKRKTITTFQKFIDEVFDNSLSDIDTQDVKIPKNFLKLCTDSLVVKDEPKNAQMSEESIPKELVKAQAERNTENRIPGNKKITLKDHIERFLEASFEEEMYDNKDTVVTSAKNLNAHLLVNDMISRGLGAGTTVAQTYRNETKKSVPSNTLVSYCHDMELAKKSNISAANQKIVIIDGDSDKEELPGTKFQEKQSQSRIDLDTSLNSPHSVYVKSQFSDSSEVRGQVNSNDELIRTYNHQDRRDPFDPRFADPRFHDNRIDVVSHEVNSHSKRDNQLERMPSSKTTVGGLAMTSQGSYHQKAHYPQGTMSVNMRHSPSVSKHDYHGLMVNTNAVTGHHVGCKCPACLSHIQQMGSRDLYPENKHRQSMNYLKQNPTDQARISPVGNQKRFYNDQSLMMNNQPQGQALHMGQSGYAQSSPKLVPQRSPIPAPPIEHNFRRSPSSAETSNNRYLNVQQRQSAAFQEYYSQGSSMNAKRSEHVYAPNYSEGYPRPSAEEMANFQANEGPSFRSSKLQLKESAKRRSEYESKFFRGQDKYENESAPLDLTLKKHFNEQGLNFGNSQHFGHPSHPTTKLSPTLTFIKHLENSVDKYCQELNSSPSPAPVVRHGRQMDNRSFSPNGKVSPMVRCSPLPSPHGSSPQGLYPPMLQGRSLPSPHYSGGITIGQPLVDKSQKTYQHVQADGYPINNEQNIATLPSQQGPSQAIVQTQSGSLPQGQIICDSTGKRITSNVSRHEPVPNLIGNHDSNDILYLYCKVCNSTYGSLYGFRKHFRNQHGFEPRAEHTIVHTISGTKSALHIPAALPVDTEQQINRSIQSGMWNARMEERRPSYTSDRGNHSFSDSYSSQISPQNKCSLTRSNQGNVEISIKQNNDYVPQIKEEKATKFLECPECGKTFQLNDFGSYKRHCRQHGHIKPFGCTDCQLSFNDQKGLKEHYKIHMKESQTIDDDKTDNLCSAESDRYSCTKCDRTFLNSAQLDTHNEIVHAKKAQSMLRTDDDATVHISDRDQLIAQTKRNIKDDIVPDKIHKICSSQSIVKQAAESMTSLACPDSSWDKADEKTQKVVRANSEISVENCDSGYSSSVGSNLSQLVPDDNTSLSGKKSDEKEGESVEVKPDFHRSESSEDNYDLFYKHKKFFHKRKRDNSISSNSGDCSSNKHVKLDPPPLTCADVPVSTSTKQPIVESCDSADQSEKGMDITQDDLIDEKLDKSDIKISESGDLTQKMKSEARHNLPFVWDRATRSRKTK